MVVSGLGCTAKPAISGDSDSWNCHGAAGAYLSSYSDSDIALGMGFELLEMALVGHRDHLGGFLLTHGLALCAAHVCVLDCWHWCLTT